LIGVGLRMEEIKMLSPDSMLPLKDIFIKSTF